MTAPNVIPIHETNVPPTMPSCHPPSVLIMLERGVIPPIANYDRPDPECDLDLVHGQPREMSGMETIILNALGLFGEGVSVVVRR